MKNRTILNRLAYYLPWVSVLLAFVSLSCIAILKIIFVFDSVVLAQTLVTISEATAVAAGLLGIIVLPRWQGLLSLGVSLVVGYLLLFTPVWALS